ncbi:hypothetical protein GE061_010508 [Apolygus lucorum]|uniref:Uncharacterized protein n=1 Tax=Apolygus lucorum TaxID=248454 RepID=A0A6A4JFW7_APOLU|nr:hypothetical protein GE061_010508 [Apolygus lucorum]
MFVSFLRQQSDLRCPTRVGEGPPGIFESGGASEAAMFAPVSPTPAMFGAIRPALVRSIRPSSGLRMFLLVLLLLLTPVDLKVFKACEVANEVLQLTIDVAGFPGGVNCSAADAARIVCVASLHDFNTSYAYKMLDNETAVGLFGVPSSDSKLGLNLAKSDDFTDHFFSLTRSQFKRNMNKTKPRLVSEMLCNDAELSLKLYRRILESWNISDVHTSPSWFYKRRVTCTGLNFDSLYIMKEELRRIYRPGVLDKIVNGTADKDDDVDAFDNNSCREMSYCMNSCSRPADADESAQKSAGGRGDPGFRKHKGRMERKVERYGRAADLAIIAIWLLAVAAALVAGYIFVRNPRRRGARRDDWSRPIVTANFSEYVPAPLE